MLPVCPAETSGSKTRDASSLMNGQQGYSRCFDVSISTHARIDLLVSTGTQSGWVAVGLNQNLNTKSETLRFRTMLVLRLDLSKTAQEMDPGLIIGSYQKLQCEDKSARFWGRRIARRLGVHYIQDGAMFLYKVMDKMLQLQSFGFPKSSSCTALLYNTTPRR